MPNRGKGDEDDGDNYRKVSDEDSHHFGDG